MDEIPEADQELLADVQDALARYDAPPPALLEAARNSLDWLNLDVMLAELISDSALTGAGALRAATPPRVLTFDADGATLVVEVMTEPRPADPTTPRRVIGQVMPPGPADVEVRGANGTTAQVRADSHGRFRATDLPDGPLALSCRFDDPSRAPFDTPVIL